MAEGLKMLLKIFNKIKIETEKYNLFNENKK